MTRVSPEFVHKLLVSSQLVQKQKALYNPASNSKTNKTASLIQRIRPWHFFIALCIAKDWSRWQDQSHTIRSWLAKAKRYSSETPISEHTEEQPRSQYNLERNSNLEPKQT
jgi:hypothetical protein